MKGRIIYNRFLLPGILCGSLLCSGFAGVSNLSGNVMNTVYAEEKKDDVIQYSYDSLGRVVSVIYPDKTKLLTHTIRMEISYFVKRRRIMTGRVVVRQRSIMVLPVVRQPGRRILPVDRQLLKKQKFRISLR